MSGLYDAIFEFVDDTFHESITLDSRTVDRVVEGIRSNVKIQPGAERRFDLDEMPRIVKMCATLRVRLTEDGDINLFCGPGFEGVLVSCVRGTSWYSSVNMVEVVAHALLLKT